MKNIKLAYSSVIASALVIIFTTVVTIWAELSPTLKNILKSFSGHHWVSKSILVVLIYLVALAIFYFLPKSINPNALSKSIINLIIITILSALTIFLFFVWHYLNA
jgi:hypothetical protein